MGADQKDAAEDSMDQSVVLYKGAQTGAGGMCCGETVAVTKNPG
jgi:hypothetical protein